MLSWIRLPTVLSINNSNTTLHSPISLAFPRPNTPLRRPNPQAIERQVAEERADLQEVLSFDAGKLSPHGRATYAALREQLESDLQMRVCKTELWDVNHCDGWQSHFAEVAERQPVETAQHREPALRRWNNPPATSMSRSQTSGAVFGRGIRLHSCWSAR
jgi:hypothetical protein